MKVNAVFQNCSLVSIDVCLACGKKGFEHDKRTRDGKVLCAKCRASGFYVKNDCLKEDKIGIEHRVVNLVDRIGQW